MRAARYAVSGIFFIFGANIGAFFPHIPDIQARLHLSNHVLGLCLLGSGLGASLVLPATGGLLHRFGSRHVCAASGALAVLFLPWVVIEPSPLAFGLNLLCVGCCYGALDVAMNAHSVAVQARFSRPILSAIHGWFSLGGFVGSGGAALAAKVGLAPIAHLWLNSAMLLLILGFCVRFLLPADVDKDAEGPKFVLPTGILLTLGLLVFCGFVSEGGVLDWCTVFLRSVLSSSASTSAIGAGVISLAMAASRFGGDSIVHRLGYKRSLLYSGFVAAIGILIAATAQSVAVSVIGFSISMFGTANMIPIFFAASGSIPGVPTGTGLSAVNTCGYAGFLVGPPLLGYVADLSSLRVSVGLLAALGLLVSLFGPKSVWMLKSEG